MLRRRAGDFDDRRINARCAARQGAPPVLHPGFGQRVLLTVDTEEEFDWTGPFRRDGYGLSHVEAIPRFQAICEALGAHPVYLVDWPIVQDPRAVADHRRCGAARHGRGRRAASPVGQPAVRRGGERAQLLCRQPARPRWKRPSSWRLRDAIEAAFGGAPLIYRAGRYGLGPHTAALLKRAGHPDRYLGAPAVRL